MLHPVVSLTQDTVQAKRDALADIAEDTSIAHAASVCKQNAHKLIASIDLALTTFMKEEEDDEDEDELPDDYYTEDDELTPAEKKNSDMDTEGMQFDFDDYNYGDDSEFEVDFWI